MKTEGKETLPERLIAPFSDIRVRSLEVCPNYALQRDNVESELTVKVARKAAGGFTVYLSNNCFRDIIRNMLEMVENKQSGKLTSAFNMLNGIPAYSGIIKHKRKILKEILESAKKHKLHLKRADFKLITKLEKYKVFADAKAK